MKRRPANESVQVAVNVTQPPGDVIAAEGEQVTLDCQFDAVDINNLYLFWYKHEVNGFPKFMLGRFSFGSTNATGYEERFDAHLDKDSKSVPLTIQRLQLSDSAVYYCALRPTLMVIYRLRWTWRRERGSLPLTVTHSHSQCVLYNHGTLSDHLAGS
uniref:Ig-like domain-containing protein n=1 Tax=Salmo trutta TaxID=8032 RepID=A0A674BEK3_SALTR